MTDTERKLLLALAEECAAVLSPFHPSRKPLRALIEQVRRETERDEEDRGR